MVYFTGTPPFEIVANALSEDRNMLNFLVKKGSALDVVANSSQALDMLMFAFHDSFTHPDTVSTIFVNGIKYGRLHRKHCVSMANSMAIVEQFRGENPERLNNIAIRLAAAMIDNCVTVADKKVTREVLLLLLENADSESVANTIGRNIFDLFHKNKAFLTQSFPVLLSTVEKLAVMEDSYTAKYCQMFPLPLDAQRFPSPVPRSFLSTFIDITRKIISPSLYATLQLSPVSKILPMSEFLLLVSDRKGALVFRKIDEKGLNAELMVALLEGVKNDSTAVVSMKVLANVLENKNNPDLFRREALYSAIKYDHKTLKKNMPAYHFFTTTTTNATADGEEIKSPASAGDLIEAGWRFGPPELISSIYGTLIPYRNVNTSCTDQFRSREYDIKKSIMCRVVNQCSSWLKQNLLNTQIVDSLWLNASDFNEGSKTETNVGNQAKLSLISTGLLSEHLLKTASKSELKIGRQVREEYVRAHGVPPGGFVKVDSKKVPETVVAGNWDVMVTNETSFSQYLELSSTNGYTPIASLALYITDARIERMARKKAREDLILFLNSAPSFATQIPESAWVGLLRIREPLNMENGLIIAMNNIGGVAAKLASKTLVAASL
jgi:hypothetical protein